MIPEQIWDLIFWISLIVAFNLSIKNLLKWIYEFFIEDENKRKGILK